MVSVSFKPNCQSGADLFQSIMAETESQALLGILFTSNQGSIPQVPKFNPG